MDSVSVKVTNEEMKIIEKLIEVVSETLADDELSVDNIVKVAVALMKTVDTYKSLSGEKKKILVCSTLRLFVEKHLDVEQTETKALLAFIDNLLPTVIDTVIDVDKQKIKIKVKSCFLSCCQKN